MKAGETPTHKQEARMRGQSLLVASLALIGAAMASAQAPAAAQNYYGDRGCEQQQQQRMVAGAIIGGVAGAVLGNNVAARNAQTEGAVLGGVAGAAAGAAIGRATADCDSNYRDSYGYNQRAPDPYYNDSGNYGYGYGQQNSGYGYGHPQNSGYGYSQPQQECRWGEQRVRDRRGRWVTQDVYLCQGPDGVWRESRY
jgi:Glycine zipper 2TM domain